MLCPYVLSGQRIDWTPEARQAYKNITTLQIDEGMSVVRKNLNSDNLIWIYLEDYGTFLKLFAQEDLRKIPDFLKASNARLNRLYRLPENNPLGLMAQGQIMLHQCALRMQQGQMLAAGNDINRAFKVLKRNQKLFPGDPGNLRLLAVLKVVFGAIPDNYKWVVSMLTSLSGSIDEGLYELRNILQTTSPETNIFYNETILITSLAESRISNNPQRGLKVLYDYLGKRPANKAQQFILAYTLMANGENDPALNILSIPLASTSIPYMDFMTGICKLNRGDADASSYFKRYLDQHKGKNYIKETHQKLAWYALLQNDRSGYVYHMQQVLIKGTATTDRDKQALLEAENHRTPHPVLLRARLAFDGGYYSRALNLLTDEFFLTLNQQSHRLEYLYRKGRILQELDRIAEALHYFHLTIDAGQYEKYYFACASSLQCGSIHEAKGNRSEAIRYYEMCLEMEPESYSNSLHREARTGLNRLGG